ncbi:MAG: 4-hydroxy-tetrahydrodipicolinate reductase [Bacteroidales bacterium]|nr:4-hydroxy-tetrahydrodipicolinate reductase [Bacteroidales bacterium]
MKIALIGYGKMGHEIEKIARSRGHVISVIIDQNNLTDFNSDEFKSSDVAIEFTRPEVAIDNYLKCFKSGIPVVSGTTGWLDKMTYIVDTCKQLEQGFFYASNFSIGVNLFFELNKKLAQLMSKHSDYSVSLEEIHHTQKLDAPSGTAISLAEQIISNHPKITRWGLNDNNESTLKITAHRIGQVPGTHNIVYESKVDKIEISHEAKNREGFATGAVLAAEFMQNKKGIYNMQDLLTL